METPIPSGSVTKAQKKLYAQLQEVLNAASGEPDEEPSPITVSLSAKRFKLGFPGFHQGAKIRNRSDGCVIVCGRPWVSPLVLDSSFSIGGYARNNGFVHLAQGDSAFGRHHYRRHHCGGCFVRQAGGRLYCVMCVAVLQCLLELFIVRNYVFAVPFLTANALLIAESMHANESIVYFMTARLTDVILGSLIGLAGTMLLWRRFSSKRLPELLSGVIRREGEFLQILLMPDTGKKQFDVHRLRVSLIQLRDEHDKALGEYPKSHSDVLWPAIAGAEHLGYSLLSAYKYNRRPAIDQKEVRRVAALFDSMAEAALKQTQPADTEVPKLQAYPRISGELSVLYNGLRTAYKR
ncbi:hypothetical protein AXI58_14960 [Bacillus nakamurai]|uniref:Integral membrane bound transporter domain-containing protein n=1 Tax=Bacillus nakamurai TaxID=1793963 RepID=A0A150F7E2_9BACI|nr:hypothetical protein AXI58_14960 [Bacillus nakamurai]